MKKIILNILIFSCIKIYAQIDTQKVLTLTTFLSHVKKYHPIAKQANLKLNEGEAILLSAKGSFDPKLYSDVDQKYFNEKRYYSLINTGFTIPIRPGIDIKANYQNNSGLFLNPENNLPQSGLWQAGISVPVGQGLFFDQRRNILKQAEIYKNATSIEQKLILNKLLYEAGNAYWNWFMSYNISIILENAYKLTLQRYNAVRQSALLGDRPLIDTLEASIQAQERLINYNQAKLDFVNKTLELSTYLWFEDNIPLEVDKNTVPFNYNTVSITENIGSVFVTIPDSIANKHPEIKLYNFKINQLEIEKKWKQEQLKPIVNFNYNALNVNTGNDFLANYNVNNYKWGFTFIMPVLLRKERGNLQLTKIKIQESILDRQNKSYEIYNKIQASANEYYILKNQIATYTKTVENYEYLLNMENKLFDTGESSLFLVNARESSAINAKLKLVDLIAKGRKAVLSYNYNIGNLSDNEIKMD